MRLTTLVALGLTVTLATLSACCDAKDRVLELDDDDDDLRPLYRDYPVRRGARANDVFGDYGYLRYGRVDE
jgi:hypothetical protein